MSDADAMLTKVLAGSDALLLPIRDADKWGQINSNRYTRSQLPGVALRMQARGDEARRKASEKELQGLAADGFLTITRLTRLRFPCVRLTAVGDARARALCGLPDVGVGRVFLKAVAERGQGQVDTLGKRWVPEIDLNRGRGWGPDATKDDRQRLSEIELDFLAAGSRGWCVAHSTAVGQAAYCATAAGLAELATPPPKPARGRRPPPQETPPEFDQAAADLYRSEQDNRLRGLAVDEPNPAGEIGPIPLATGDFRRASGGDS